MKHRFMVTFLIVVFFSILLFFTGGIFGWETSKVLESLGWVVAVIVLLVYARTRKGG